MIKIGSGLLPDMGLHSLRAMARDVPSGIYGRVIRAVGAEDKASPFFDPRISPSMQNSRTAGSPVHVDGRGNLRGLAHTLAARLAPTSSTREWVHPNDLVDINLQETGVLTITARSHNPRLKAGNHGKLL